MGSKVGWSCFSCVDRILVERCSYLVVPVPMFVDVQPCTRMVVDAKPPQIALFQIFSAHCEHGCQHKREKKGTQDKKCFKATLGALVLDVRTSFFATEVGLFTCHWYNTTWNNSGWHLCYKLVFRFTGYENSNCGRVHRVVSWLVLNTRRCDSLHRQNGCVCSQLSCVLVGYLF